MYQGGRADARARRLSRLWATVFGLGLGPRRWVSLEVTGRKSGRIVRFPAGMADLAGQWYLVSMLGERCNWVLNVRASGGRAVISCVAASNEFNDAWNSRSPAAASKVRSPSAVIG